MINTEINKAHVGGTDIDKIYIGTTLAYEKTKKLWKLNITTEEGCTIQLTGSINITVTKEWKGVYTIADVPAGTVYYTITKKYFNTATGTIVLPNSGNTSTKYITVDMSPSSRLTNRVNLSSWTNMGGVTIRSEYRVKSEISVSLIGNYRVDSSTYIDLIKTVVMKPSGGTYQDFSVRDSVYGAPSELSPGESYTFSDDYYDYKVN